MQKKAVDPNVTMKKHTGWSKIMKGVVKAQTPVAASGHKRQGLKYFSNAKDVSKPQQVVKS